MLSYWKGKLDRLRDGETEAEPTETPLTGNLLDDLVALRARYHNSADFLCREVELGGTRTALLMIEGMINLQTFSELLLEPLLNQDFGGHSSPEEIRRFVSEQSVLAADMTAVCTGEEVFRFIMSGFAVLLIDGLPGGIAFGLQGFNFRSISEPSGEVNERGSREGFTEPLRINMTMVRRRIKSPSLKFELLTLGRVSQTDLCLIYMTDKVNPRLLREVRSQLKRIKLDVVLTSGYIQPFLEGKPWSLFSDVGTTERPDTLAAKVMEGRICILVDGTPFALITPYLFSENFQSLDDYAHRAYFATFIRFIKYLSFLTAMLLPALYVAIGTFHPELLPQALLFNVAAAEEVTPFPLMAEALIIHLLYEIMREAGLRLPRPIGHAVGIVGALVIGDAAVTAGLIGSPMILVIAMTAIASFVVPSLYEPVAILRLVFILAGGFGGLYGVALACMIVLVNISALNRFGAPYMAPISPFSWKAMRDTFIRASFTRLQRRTANLEDLKGVDL